jgi:hypothetical protein
MISQELSRRGLFRVARAVVGGLVLSSFQQYQPPQEEKTQIPNAPKEIIQLIQIPENPLFKPEVIHGIEVYGLAEPIKKEEQVLDLYSHFDKLFGDTHGVVVQGDAKAKNEQRKEFLPKNERFLEIIVRRSAYDKFLERREETKVDFVEWVQMEVGITSLVFENSIPPTHIRGVLRRVVVADDELVASQWDEEAFKRRDIVNNHEAYNYDVIWRFKMASHYPIDIDQSWAIAYDYRPGGNSEHTSGYLYWLRQNEFMLMLHNENHMFQFPKQNNFLSGKDNLIFDGGMPHEWIHYWFNGPDVYQFDIKKSGLPSRFNTFIVPHNFDEPYISPYLTMRLNYNVKMNYRSHELECQTGGMTIHPEAVQISLKERGILAQDVYVYSARLNSGYYEDKSFIAVADNVQKGGRVIFNDWLFGEEKTTPPHVWLLVTYTASGHKELFFPAAAFNMSKLAGLDDVKYEINFTGADDPESKTMVAEIVDDSFLESKIREFETRGNAVYATMRIEGTGTWMVWLLSKNTN